MLKHTRESFKHVISNREADIEKCMTKVRDLNEQMVEALKDGENVSELQNEVVLQLSIAANHRKVIESIHADKEKKTVRYHDERDVWVIYHYVERTNLKSALMGLNDVKKKLGRFMKVDDFEPNNYEVVYEQNHVMIAAKDNRCDNTTLRFANDVKEGVFKFKVKVMSGDNISIGCVSNLIEKKELGRHNIRTIGYAYATDGKWWQRLEQNSFGGKYGPGDIIEIIIDMDTCWLRCLLNGEDQGIISLRLPKNGVFPAISLGKNDKVIVYV